MMLARPDQMRFICRKGDVVYDAAFLLHAAYFLVDHMVDHLCTAPAFTAAGLAIANKWDTQPLPLCPLVL